MCFAAAAHSVLIVYLANLVQMNNLKFRQLLPALLYC